MSHDEPMSETNGDRLPIDPELISAFFDGETTPQERAAVEESMEDGGATLLMLDEYDQLSQSLKQLHRAAGSPDLKASVLAQIQPPAPVASPAMSKPRRRMLSVVAGLTGVAAAVTLMMWPGAPHENMLAVNDAEYEYTAAEPAIAMSSSSELPAPAAGRGAPAPDAARVNSAAAPELMSAPAMAEMEAGVNSSLADSSLAELASERPLPEVGDVLGYLDQNADELTWVAVTVVDVQTAGDQVQLLLTRHGVESPDTADEAPDLPASPEDRMTFLVEADWDQVEAVIVDLSDSQFINELAVNAPHDEGVPKELQDYRIERAGDPAADEQALAANQLVQELKNRVQSRQKPAAPDRPASIAQFPAGERSDAVQLQLLVPDLHLKRIAARRGVEPALAATQSDATAPDAPAEADAAEKAETPPPESEASRIGLPLASRRAKVVIVIQTQNR